jgi:hypothetical protein
MYIYFVGRAVTALAADSEGWNRIETSSLINALSDGEEAPCL